MPQTTIQSEKNITLGSIYAGSAANGVTSSASQPNVQKDDNNTIFEEGIPPVPTAENVAPPSFNTPNPPARSKSAEDAKMQLDNLVRQSNKTLYKIQSVFPFDLFPKQLIIEGTAVNIIYKAFFMSQQVNSLALRDIMSVTVETSPFFATIRLQANEEFVVSFLKKTQARRAQQIIQGLIMCAKQGIDLSKLEVKEVLDKIQSLGTIAAAPNENT